AEGLVNPDDDKTFPGGLLAGVFPPLRNDASRCPQLPMAFFAAPGSVFGGHHSYPGGLPVHEAFNLESSLSLANGYRAVYGQSGHDELPMVDKKLKLPAVLPIRRSDVEISQDVMIAAPIWHDWAKPIVFQWNADGTEFAELNFGGAGKTDN